VDGLSEKMKEIVDLANDLDGLDKAAWMEIINVAEDEIEKKQGVTTAEGEENLARVLGEIAPFIKIIRLGLASDTISRIDRCRLVSTVLSEVSGLLSPTELAGVCFTMAVRCLPIERTATIIATPFPFGMEFGKKKDEGETGVV